MNQELTSWLVGIGGLTWTQLLLTGAAICMVGYTLAHLGWLTRLNQKLFGITSPMLVKCEVCQHKVSKNAAACPHCGEPFLQAEDKPRQRRGF